MQRHTRVDETRGNTFVIDAMPSSTGRRAGSLRSLIADFAAGPDTVISHFSLAVAKKEHLDLCYLTVGINLSLPRISGDKGKLGSSAMLDGSRDLRVGLRFILRLLLCAC